LKKLERLLRKTKGLVIGCGSIGERHLYNLKKLGIQNIGIFDTCKKKVNDLSKKYKTLQFFDLDSALSFEPDFSMICTFPKSHVSLANACINSNSHVFIEKPISTDLKGVEAMLRKAKSKGVKVSVGYNLRFDKGLNFFKKKLKNNEIGIPISIKSESGNNIKFWRPGLDYRSHYILKKGGGIILDGSHEYDYLRWLLEDEPSSVFCLTKKSQSIKTQTESLASITLKFKKGTIANIIMDYVRPRYKRCCHCIGEKGDLNWDYIPQKNFWNKYRTKSISKVKKNLLNRISSTKNFSVNINDMYVNEVKNFIHSFLNKEKILVDGWEGFHTLKVGIAALESAKTGKIISL